LTRNHHQRFWRQVAHRVAATLFIAAATWSLLAHGQDVASPPPLTVAQQGQVKESEVRWRQGYEFLGAGKLAEATTEIQAAVTIERGVYGDQHDQVLANMKTLAELYELREQFAVSLTVHAEIQTALTKRFGEAHWKVTDERIAAEDCQRRGKLSGPDRKRLREAVTASQAMDKLYTEGQFAAALGKAEFVVQRRRELLGERTSTFALSLAKLALVHSCLGNYDEAESLYESALAIERETLGKQHPEYATTLSNLAVQCDEAGEFAKAERLYLEAKEIRRQALGEQSSDYATSLNNLAVHYDLLGDFTKSEALYLQAVEIKRIALGERHQDYMTSLNNLGRHFLTRGDLAQAEPRLVRAMELRKQVLGEKHAQYAGSLNSLGLLYQAKRDFEQAENLFEQAREILKTKLGEKHANYSTTLGFLAGLHHAKGEYAKAESQYREVLALRQAALGNQHPDVAAAGMKLSLSLLHQDKTDEARLLATQAAEVIRRHVDAVASIQSDRQQFATARQSYSALDALLSILVRIGSATDSEYNEILQAKGRVWQRQRDSRETARAVTQQPELAQRVIDLRSLAASRAQLMLNVPSPKSVDDWRRRLEEVTQQQESLERELSEQSVALRNIRQPVSPADIRNVLPADAALVDVFEYLHELVPSAEPSAALHERRLVAFVIRHDVPGVTLVSLGPVKPLSRAIDTWRQSFGKRPESQAAARLLRQRIWEPLEPHLTGAGLVLVSPDGILGRFPLAALPGKVADSYLLEDVSLAVVPCAMALPRMLDDSVPRIEVPGQLLIAANIDYDAATPTPTAPPVRKFGRQLAAVRGADWKGFTPLAATRGEMASIERLYRDTFGKDGLTLLEGTGAREQRFCEEAVRHKFLHIATHGFYAPSALKSALHDSEEQARSVSLSSSTGAQFIGYPPGLLSGIALSGANRDPEPDREDGILTASEVENLDLRGVQLAVLSACETGLGEVAGGEGQLGLQRAFQVAGTQTVVASLWPVSDTATRTMMERFYENMFRKENPLGTLEALREAQLWMLREGQERGLVRIDNAMPGESKRSPPFYWAAFVLSGDWR
jgi:CHAT domain-containing protein